MIASEMVKDYGSRPLAQTLERVMLARPDDWMGHYHGDETALRLQRHYSYSDRIRYYWNNPEVEASVGRLVAALKGVTIPATLLHQYLPSVSHDAVIAGDPQSIALAAVDNVLVAYDRAVRPDKCGTAAR